MPLLSRLREALLPEFEVEREIGHGGMGTVYLAREVALDRPVAIKIIRPEIATARAVDRFQREARTLAKLTHPNIVPVHHVGARAGFFYYVMEFIPGETLAARIARGPLSLDEVRKLGRDLLDALEVAHRHDVIHRDVKPQNIFLVGGRFVLGDFGIATSSTVDTPPDADGKVIVGTPQYMPPEQRYGWEIGPRTDLYGVGMVLYEAITRRRWNWFLPDDKPDWSKVPRRSGMLRVLQRALAFRPADRWPDARAFRQALWRTRIRKYAARTVALTASGLTVGAAIVWFVKPTGLPLADLAVTEFQVAPPADPIDGIGLANYVQAHLQAYRIDGAPGIVLARMEPLPDTSDAERALKALRAKAYVRGRVVLVGDSLEARLVLVRQDRPPSEVPLERGRDLGAMACALGRGIVRLLERPIERYECIRSTEDIPGSANRLFNAGEVAFRQQAWDTAESLYVAALDVDPSFAWARWRLLNAQRWMRDRPYEDQLRDLEELSEQQGGQLLEVDRHLLEAWLTPFGQGRFAKYQEAIDDLERDPYTWLVYGDDLFARGALVGIALDSARKVLERSVEYDSTMGPALMDLAWMAIRQGDADSARDALNRLRRIAAPDAATIPPRSFDLAYTLRFGTPEQQGAAMAQALDPGNGTGDFASFLRMLRWGLSFDVAPAQLAIANAILGNTSLPDSSRVLVLEARGLALVATGRYLPALAAFDEVAALSRASEAALQAAQWRVLPHALGLEAVPDAVVDSGVVALESLAADPAIADRAAWALAVHAYARGDVAGAQRRLRAIRARGDPASADLLLFLEALQRAAEGDVAGALDATATLVPYVSERGSEPFLRSAVYLTRGEWKRMIDPRAVPFEWLWHLNADLRGWPVGLAQAGEIDWAFGTYARLLRARALFGARGRREACAELARLGELWEEVDAAYEPLHHETLTLLSERCR
jgi:tetratricopeptide (TPR) repeat protein